MARLTSVAVLVCLASMAVGQGLLSFRSSRLAEKKANKKTSILEKAIPQNRASGSAAYGANKLTWSR